MTILITGVGPFPGAPFNPTGPLALALARRRSGERRVAHVFQVSYATIDRELPILLAREQPRALVMFGLAGRTRHLRIETRARNAFARALADVDGYLPLTAVIAPTAPALLPLRAPTLRLLRAAQATGVPAALSRDAGRYLCNYLCWRAAEASRAGAPRLIAFVHVPSVRRRQGPPARRTPELTMLDLIRAGEAIMRAASVAAR